MSKQLKFDFMEEEKVNKNLGRVLTVKLTVTDPAKANWLWVMKNNPELGVHVSGLSNGDMFARESLMEETLGKLEEKVEHSPYLSIKLITEAFKKLDEM